MEKKRQLKMLGWAALIPLFILVWVLSSEEPPPPEPIVADKQVVDSLPEIAEQPTGLGLEDKENFKTWAIENTIVTELEYPQDRDDQLRVRLKKEKYTTQEAAEKVALYLARYYKMETGFLDPVTVTIIYPDRPETFVEGNY